MRTTPTLVMEMLLDLPTLSKVSEAAALSKAKRDQIKKAQKWNVVQSGERL